ncbi:hypothetical protein [Ferrimonas balearica]|uniref:hypothetical protein n=1 Tax=Ferrimonas balearica TaxID=44012 RepID=UPI001C586FDB|nr:hypothetical protein [Ferrimonas balearica]MBW3163692.1 hypothetical protein [Ferrimonas balearica]
MEQAKLELVPVRMQEVDSVGMGILPNGETFLSLQGLARFCGTVPSVIIELAQDWEKGEAQRHPRGQQIAQLIMEWTDSDTVPRSLYVQLDVDSNFNSVIHAVPESIAMAITDYYAHYAQTTKREAVSNYRKAAKLGLRRYIYERLDYREDNLIEQSWRLFQERIVLNEAPRGYFTMFDQATPIIASLIRHGIPVDDSIMPDGSLGIAWARYWKDHNLSNQYGERIKIDHKFPESYRQADPRINAYPNDALSAFRSWFEETYLPQKYPAYIKRKVSEGKIKLESIPLLLNAVLPPSLEDKRIG